MSGQVRWQRKGKWKEKGKALQRQSQVTSHKSLTQLVVALALCSSHCLLAGLATGCLAVDRDWRGIRIRMMGQGIGTAASKHQQHQQPKRRQTVCCTS